MEMTINRDGIQIVPESPADEAYIEDTLGLKKKGDFLKLVRVAPMGLDLSIAYLEAVQLLDD